ncbi:MAG: hypothetical protein RIS86_1913 [Planctomycetota bacterium]
MIDALLAAVASSTPTALGVGFTLFGALCVVLVVAALPGSWILIAAAVAVDAVDRLWLPPDAPFTFHPLTILVAILVALAGEALELLLSAFGAKRFGASRAGMVGSVAGGMLGALGGTVLIPVPVVGTIAGAAIGTALGAVAGETWNGERTVAGSARPAFGAVLGRVLGTLAKLPVALAVWILLSIAAFVR